MTPTASQPPPRPNRTENASALVTGVLVGAGGFYTVTNSVLATTVVTALAVALAAKSFGTRR